MQLNMTQNREGSGQLKVNVTARRTSRPIANATVQISYTGGPGNTIEELTTDNMGVTQTVDLDTPPLEYSLSAGNQQPYSEYSLNIQAPGYESQVVTGVQLLEGVTAVQDVTMMPEQGGDDMDRIVIGPHTLYGEYPPKIAEAEIKPISDTGEIVLSRIVIPEYVVVHDGPPNDTTAQNYYVRYRDYIKNVASSEIYATWPENSIRANVLAIMSFTLNRVYTEWYRNKGYNFTITSSTAYDHKFIYGRNVYDTISRIVDELFGNYLSRPNVRQPILTQYCDGQRVTCPNWMSQWGSKYLADQGYSAIEILRNYYGSNMYINIAEEISGVPSSWPGYTLSQGSRGAKVRQLQEQINAISEAYSAIPAIAVDGIYGPRTAEAVRAFQSAFGLPQTGTVDYQTWYKISEIYVGVTRIAQL